MNPLASVFLGLILNDDMMKIFLYNTQTLEENRLNVSLGIEIWKEQVTTQIHILFWIGKKVNASVNVFKLLYGQFVHLGPHATELQLILDINFVGM